MADVPQDIQDECKERFGELVFFVFSNKYQKFICKVRDPHELSYTYDLFIVEDRDKKYRPISLEDIYRADKSKLFNDEQKECRIREMQSALAKERRQAVDSKAAVKAEKRAVMNELVKDVTTNPIMANAFVKDAKAKFSVDIKEQGKRGVGKTKRK